MAAATTTLTWITKLETFASELETLAPTGSALIKDVISAITGVSIPSGASGSSAGSTGSGNSTDVTVEAGIVTDVTAVAGAVTAGEKLAAITEAAANTPAMVAAATAQNKQNAIDAFNLALQNHDPEKIRQALAAL